MAHDPVLVAGPRIREGGDIKTIQYDGPGDLLEVGDVVIPRGVPTQVSEQIAKAVASKVTVVSTSDDDQKGGE